MYKLQNMMKARANLREAEDLVGLIGKESHATHREPGKLSSIAVQVKIHHQMHNGSTNYHDSKVFDDALSQAAREAWPELRDRAIEILREKLDATRAAARSEFVELFGGDMP